jgi:hypothetical protein
MDQFVNSFGAALGGLTEEDFLAVDGQIHEQAEKTEFANADGVFARGSKLRRIGARLRQLLRKYNMEVEDE